MVVPVKYVEYCGRDSDLVVGDIVGASFAFVTVIATALSVEYDT